MRSRLLLLLSLSFLALPSCSGSDTTGGSGASGPSATAPEGSINTEIYATPEQSCPVGDIHIDIGNSRQTPPMLEIDGWEGASVACAVVPDAALFDASATLKKGSFDFTIKDVKTDGTSATGTVSFTDPVGAVRYTSAKAAPCVFQFAPGSGQGVEAGKVWMQFDCSALVSEKDATKSCSSRYGYLLVDRCAKK